MTHDVFISYPSKNKLIADAICSKLESNNIRCWYAPRDILPGKDYAEALVDAISFSKIFVLVFSEETNNSSHIMSEVRQAFNHNLIIIPFRTHDIKPSKSLEFYIGAPHWLDALTPPVEKHMDKLVNVVQQNLKIQNTESFPQPPAPQYNPLSLIHPTPTKIPPPPPYSPPTAHTQLPTIPQSPPGSVYNTYPHIPHQPLPAHLPSISKTTPTNAITKPPIFKFFYYAFILILGLVCLGGVINYTVLSQNNGDSAISTMKSSGSDTNLSQNTNSNIQIIGNTYGRSSVPSNGIDTIVFDIGPTAGSSFDVSKMTIIVTQDGSLTTSQLKYSPTSVSETTFTVGTNNGGTSTTEMTNGDQGTIKFKLSPVVPPNKKLLIELKPDYGNGISFYRTVPPAISSTNILY